ncbi:MAG: 4Fe-4S binding protein [Candidatus Bathyarchaeota archaeon]|nr:4Fe-4S binding protein [Candidatus Termiticorpusculum sp.]
MPIELPANIVLPIFAAVIILGIFLILKLTKDKTRNISTLRLFIQIMAVPLMFLGLIIGPFYTELWLPMGITPRNLLLGANFFGTQFPDGLTVPFMACYYSNGRTITCGLWQLQAYIFPYYNYANGYNAVYSIAGIEKIAMTIALLISASIVFGKAFCGWICPFGLYMDILTRIRKFFRFRRLHISDKSNAKIAQLRYIALAVALIISVILSSYAIFGTEFIPGTTPAGPTGQSGYSGALNEPFCLVCPMRPLCILAECSVGLMKFSYIEAIGAQSPFWISSFYVSSLNLIILIVITILALMHRRIFCRICPLGGLISLFSTFTPFKQIALTKLEKNEQKCKKCGVCKRVCPTQATDVYEKKDGDVTESKCILCARCLETCPNEGALSLKFAGKTVMDSRNWLE